MPRGRASGPSRRRPRRRGRGSCPCPTGSRRGRCRRIAAAWCGRYRSDVPWKLADRTLDLELPLAVGIVNITTDSMFDGARSRTPEQAVRDGLESAEAGFDMLDVGAVAARSGPPVAAEEEAAALIPTLEGLADAIAGNGGVGPPISADTFSAEVAKAALAAGASAVNDISGGSDEMLELIAVSGCGYVLMHIEGPPRVSRAAPSYGDVVGHLETWFGGRVERALA